MQSLLNKKNVDYTKQPLFLGEGLSLQRYDRFKYPIFFDMFKKQMEFFWRPEEIELKKDRNDFKNDDVMSENERFIFTSNLKYQTMMDSVICRGVPTLMQFVSNPELEACMNVWQFFEQIHSYSYTYIIKNVYSNPSEILDSCLTDKEILKRADVTVKEYDALNHGDISKMSKKQLKKQIYLTIISVNILEAVRFYVSFICAFAFAENKKMVGNADIIKLIKRDEALHLYNTQEIIKILMSNPEEGFLETAKECEEEACKMFERAAAEEKAWASYLFQNGSIIGLNEQVMSEYVDHLCMSRRQKIGLPFEKKRNPIAGWTDPWMNSESVQVAPQEHEITSYKIGASKNDLEDTDFGGFDL